ncbi:cytochrome b-c1 complex subunit 10 [Irpex lacteus]|nr:cytochrome b-c1 complex subunit 10 [Irpex lacteus]
MSRVVFHPQSTVKITNNFARQWTGSAALWGAGAGLAALYLLSVTPKIKRELLVKIPVLGSYYEDKVPASDKPF